MDRKIRILEVIRQGQIGGGESHLLDLIYFMDRERYEPVCLSFTYGEMIRRLEAQGVKCHVIESQKAFDPGVQKRVKQIMREEQVDIVHAHGSRAASNILYPARSLHLPIIYTVHGWSFHDDQPIVVKTVRTLSERFICNMVQRVICVSDSNAETGRKLCGLKSPIIIENGINMKRFNPDQPFPDLRPEFGFSTDDFVVGFIARDTVQKAPLLYLEAIGIAHRRNPKVKALFVAEGELDAEADHYIEKDQMQGFVYHSKFRHDVPAVLHSIDAYCLPSLWEGLPIALLEAMAMGKAVIATPTDGTKELLSDANNGILIPFNNPMALADAILLFMENKEFKKECEDNARRLVSKRFNAQRVADSVQEIYETFV
jgi:glycosyltransferase involved in cell wall biosynthesis